MAREDRLISTSSTSSNTSQSSKRRRTQESEITPMDNPPIIFRFTSTPPNQVLFAKFLNRVAPAAAITNVSRLRDGTGYLVRGALTAINKLKTVHSSQFPDHEFTSHVPKPRTEENNNSFVIRYVHIDVGDAEILEELKRSNGIEPLKVLRIHSKEFDKATQLVRVITKTQADADKAIKDGVHIGYAHHRCEASHPKPKVTQCFKCLGFGHEANKCIKNTKCVRCGEDGHVVKDCTVERAHVKCGNCGEQHPATYKGCQVYKQAVQAAPRPNNYASAAKGNTPHTACITPIQCAAIVTEVITAHCEGAIRTFADVLKTVVNAVERHLPTRAPTVEELEAAVQGRSRFARDSETPLLVGFYQ